MAPFGNARSTFMWFAALAAVFAQDGAAMNCPSRFANVEGRLPDDPETFELPRMGTLQQRVLRELLQGHVQRRVASAQPGGGQRSNRSRLLLLILLTLFPSDPGTSAHVRTCVPGVDCKWFD